MNRTAGHAYSVIWLRWWILDSAPSPPCRPVGEWERKDQPEAHSVAVAWGWLMRLKRTGRQFLSLRKQAMVQKHHLWRVQSSSTLCRCPGLRTWVGRDSRFILQTNQEHHGPQLHHQVRSIRRHCDRRSGGTRSGSAIGLVTNTGFAWYVIRASRRAFKRSDSALDLDDVIMKDDTDGSLIVVDDNTSR